MLFKIDAREYDATVRKAEADKLKAAAAFKQSVSEEKRADVLRRQGTLSAEEFDQRVAARETADAVLKQTEAALEAAQLERSFTQITAEIAGQIGRALVTRGNLVGQNESTLLTTIVSVDELFVFFDVPERDLVEYLNSQKDKALPEPTSRKIRVEVGVATEKGYPHVGVIDFRDNRVDTGTGTIRIRGRVPNPQLPPNNTRLLYAGLYSRVRVPSGEPQELLTLPEEALLAGQEGRYVYVLNERNVVEKRTVTVGPKVWSVAPGGDKAGAADWTLTNPRPVAPPDDKTPAPPAAIALRSVIAIEKGIEPTDRVIVNGLQKAQPGMAVNPDEWSFKSPAASAAKH